jgi:hypothetical protein
LQQSSIIGRFWCKYFESAMPSRNRGKRKPKLRDLSVNPLTPKEINALLDAINAATAPIAVAILGAVLVEHELERSLHARLRVRDDAIWQDMMDERGPLSTFARKIAMGHALRLYDEDFRDNLDIIRVIRNAFAHSKQLLEFSHPLVSGECKKIKIPNKQKRAFRLIVNLPPRFAYVFLCLRLASEMIRKRTARVQRSTKRLERKFAVRSPFYSALAPALGVSGTHPFSFLAGQSADPKSEASKRMLDALFQEPPKTGDK